MAMNPTYKQPWIAALRSGEYEQARSVLYNGTGYCCLGVLCKVAGSDFYVSGGDEDEAAGPVSYRPTDIGDIMVGNEENLTDYGREFFGLTAIEGDTLTAMNDGRRVWSADHDPSPSVTTTKSESFAEIADWIEENL